MPHRRLAAALAAAALLAAAPVHAEMRALVIGIDAYLHSPLKGAVNDAQDLAAALKAAGVKDMQVLLNDQASRDGIERAWRDLIQRAKTGDTVVLTYAGHGAQEPEHVKGSEEDGKDEVLLLGKFDVKGPGSRERIIDDELNGWFRQAGERGLKVVFIADACHSGTLTRSLDRRTPAATYRVAPPYDIADDELKLDLPPETAAMTADDLPHVTFLSGAQEDQKVPEISIPDANGRPTPRGALSYMVARALEGEADDNLDGVVTRGELKIYVRENVRKRSEARQTPNFLPPSGDDEPVFRVASGGAGGPIGRTEPARLAAVQGTQALPAGLSNVVPVTAGEAPDLMWDAQRREVISGLGDVVATEIGAAELQGVVDKWRAIQSIQDLGRAHSLVMTVSPNDGTHRQGSEIAFEITGMRSPFLTLFSLAGDGTLAFHFPLPGDTPSVATGKPFRMAFAVTPPFGAEHVVAITSPAVATQLNAALAALDGKKAGAQLISILAAKLVPRQQQVGLQGLYTAAQ